MTYLHGPRDMDVFDQDETEPPHMPPQDNAGTHSESSLENAGDSASWDAHPHHPLSALAGPELEAAAWSDQPPLEPDMDAVQVFWEEARKVAGLTVANVVVGETPLGLIPPPVWQFRDVDNQAKLSSRLAQLVANGIKHATSSAAWEYAEDSEPLPQAGDMSIICDGAGRPAALVVTQEVQILPFDQVDQDFAAAEGEDDQTLDTWRLTHVRLLKGYQDRAKDEPWPHNQPWPSDEMVLERLECLYPKPHTTGKHLFR